MKIFTITLILLSFSTHSQLTLQDSLVYWYKLDNNSVDSSGNGYDGIEFNGVTYDSDRFGNPFGAARFDGIDDRIEGADTSNYYMGATDFSISIWFYTDSVYPISKVFLSKRPHCNGGNDDFIDVYIASDSTLHSWHQGAFSSGSFSLDVNVDYWHHFIYVRESDTNKIYFDGQLVFTNVSSFTSYPQAKWILGDSPTCTVFAGSNPFDGKLDDFRVYNRAISYCEVQQLYTDVILDAVIVEAGGDLTTGTFTSYQWLLDGVSIINATNQSYTIISNGNYQVVVWDDSGCTDTSSIYIINDLSISEIPNNINIYSIDGVLKIESESILSSVEVFSTDGRLVYKSDNLNSTNELISLDGSKIYFVQIITKSDESIIKKIYIQ